MFRLSNFSLFGILLLFPATAAMSQELKPQSIRFEGQSEYTQAELLAAVDLKKGVVYTSDELNRHAQQLLGIGVFEKVGYKFDGVDLVFQVTLATTLYPVVFQNLPFPSGKELDAELRRQFPLYHGKVPSEGGLADSVTAVVQDMLKAKGVQATVVAAPVFDPVSHQTAAVSYAVTAPAVLVGEVTTQGAAVALDPGARAVLAQIPGIVYDTAGSPRQIETLLSTYYNEQGYLEAAIHATASGKPVIAPDAVRVPFLVVVDPGIQFKLAGIQLGSRVLVTQADFDKQSGLHAGDVADGKHLREEWSFVERQYHNQGYMKAKITATPTFDPAHQTVAYAVDADPGPQYTMGTFTVDNVTDQLRDQILSVWKMPAGSVFNEGAIRGFLATHGVNPALERVFATVNCKYTMNLHDDSHTVDLTLRLEKKP